MVSKDHKRRVLDHQAAQAADAHTEKPLVFLGADVIVDPEEVIEEDAGSAMIFEVDLSGGSDSGPFVRIHSWDESGQHKDFRRLVGREIKVVIRTID